MNCQNGNTCCRRNRYRLCGSYGALVFLALLLAFAIGLILGAIFFGIILPALAAVIVFAAVLAVIIIALLIYRCRRCD